MTQPTPIEENKIREIKFRAYAPEDNCMYDWEAIKDWPIERLNSDKKWKYMQFTGLHDKNGKEIYCGDIVKHPKFGKYIVEWRDEKMGYNLIKSECYEVIGDIYSNPDLLN
jgi:hypothetical protein